MYFAEAEDTDIPDSNGDQGERKPRNLLVWWLTIATGQERTHLG
jgi:hypothetical protein